MNSFAKSGYVIFKNIVKERLFADVEASIIELILKEVKSPDLSGLVNCEESTKNPSLFIQKSLLVISRVSPSSITTIINCMMHTPAFFALISDRAIMEAASNLFFDNIVGLNKLSAAELNLRLDLPNIFRQEDARYSLGWHQESSYFSNYVSHSKGIVVWIPLFDTAPPDGGIVLIPESHRHGTLKHSEIYMDPENKKNLRRYLGAAEEYGDPSSFYVSRGSAVFMDFNLIHRSGVNLNQEKPRVTFQARISDMTASDFVGH